MRYILLVSIPVLLLLVAACGGDDDNTNTGTVPDELKTVCTQSANAATDKIKITAPKFGDTVGNPMHVIGQINSSHDPFFFSIVDASGAHIADYPGHPTQTGTTVNFIEAVPFGVQKETQACLWVYIDNSENPEGAIRIPINVRPGSSTPTG